MEELKLTQEELAESKEKVTTRGEMIMKINLIKEKQVLKIEGLKKKEEENKALKEKVARLEKEVESNKQTHKVEKERLLNANLALHKKVTTTKEGDLIKKMRKDALEKKEEYEAERERLRRQLELKNDKMKMISKGEREQKEENVKQNITIERQAKKQKENEEEIANLKRTVKAANGTIMKLKEGTPCPKKAACPGEGNCGYSHKLRYAVEPTGAKIACRFEIKGNCTRGDGCTFSHAKDLINAAKNAANHGTPESAGRRDRGRSLSKSGRSSGRDPRRREKSSSRTPRSGKEREERRKSVNRGRSPIKLGNQSRSPSRDSRDTSRSAKRKRSQVNKTVEVEDDNDSSIEELPVPVKAIKMEKVETSGNVQGVLPLPPQVRTPGILDCSHLNQVMRLPVGEDGALIIKKIQKSPLYTVRSVRNVLMQDAALFQQFSNFMTMYPQMKQAANKQIKEQAEVEKEERRRVKKDKKKEKK